MIAVVILGFAVGLVSTFLGIGGGLLIVPILPLLVTISIREVVATAQASVLFVVGINSVSFARKHTLPRKVILPLCIGGGIGAFAAANLNMILADKIVVIVLDLLLWVLAGILFYKSARPTTQIFNSIVSAIEGITGKTLFLFFVGFIAGGCGGFTGIGAGVIVTSFLAACEFISPGLIVPASNLVMFFSTLCSVISYSFLAGETSDLSGSSGGLHAMGYVRWDLAAIIFFSSMVTGVFGWKHQHLFSAKVRQLILATILCVAAIHVGLKF